MIKILMIAPDDAIYGGGGIARYANILTHHLDSKFSIKRVVTTKDIGKLKKIAILIFAILKTIFFLIRYREVVAHIHLGEEKSFLRKLIFIKLCNFFNRPTILHLHSPLIEDDFKKMSKDKQKKIAKVFKEANKVIVLSEQAKKWYLTAIERREPFVVYNGMDDLLTSNKPLIQRKNIILFLGRLGERKGTYDLIKAFKNVQKEHPDALLLLAGDGEIDKCKRVVNSLELDSCVKFLGWIDIKEKQRLLNSSKIFVLPSYHEAFPLSILEAMSTGLPIISTRVGGIPEEIIDNKSGVLIESGDILALTLTINRLLSSPKLCDRLGKKARERYLECFLITKIIKKIEEIYKI